jgi:pyroglutamyl-peptidase
LAANRKSPVMLLTGFEPFGGERSNPSWEVARRLHRKHIGGLEIVALRLPVATTRAARRLSATIDRIMPDAVLGLGQAGGRPSLSLERIAINLVDDGMRDGSGMGGAKERPVMRGGPDAYFSRLPLARILRELGRAQVPAAYSLSAGAFICNAVMYASLHRLRAKPAVPAGFIHLPHSSAQASRHRNAASMTIELMERGTRVAIAAIARSIKASRRAHA